MTPCATATFAYPGLFCFISSGDGEKKRKEEKEEDDKKTDEKNEKDKN